MEWLSFISVVVSSVAWPVTTLVIVLLMRKELVGLLPYIRRLKAGPIEAEFEREVKELKDEAAVSLPPAPPQLLENKSQRLFQLANISPRAAILEAWQGVEFAVRRAALQRAGSPVPDLSSPVRALRELTQLKLLTSEDIALFHDLRGLRNQATHAPDFNPSYEAVANYLHLAGTLRARFEVLAGNDS